MAHIVSDDVCFWCKLLFLNCFRGLLLYGIWNITLWPYWCYLTERNLSHDILDRKIDSLEMRYDFCGCLKSHSLKMMQNLMSTAAKTANFCIPFSTLPKFAFLKTPFRSNSTKRPKKSQIYYTRNTSLNSALKFSHDC